MCGITGFIAQGPLHHQGKRADFFEQALYADALRGMHSTGIFTVKKNNAAFFIKDNVEARLFLNQRNVNQFIRAVASDTRVVVGHNRHATIGGRGVEAAHPYTTENVTLVHNGTLRDYSWLPEHESASTDSARLAQAISDADPGGISVLEKVQGALALVWYDHRVNSLYITRNDERPLTYVAHDDHLYFASEGPMLTWLLERNGIATGKSSPRYFDKDTLYVWDVGAEGMQVKKPKRIKYKRYTPPPVVKSQQTYYHAQQARWWSPEDEGDAKKIEVATSKRDVHLAARFKVLGLDLSPGDNIEVMSGEFVQYKGGEYGKMSGYLDVDVMDNIAADYTGGQLWADVHGVPAKAPGGVFQDSYIASVKGIVPYNAEAGGSPDDTVLLCTFREFAMFRVAIDWGNAYLDTFFEGENWYYNHKDTASIPWPEGDNIKLTRREADQLSLKMLCIGCSVPGTLTPTDSLNFIPGNPDKFICKDCNEKERKGIHLVT